MPTELGAKGPDVPGKNGGYDGDGHVGYGLRAESIEHRYPLSQLGNERK